MSDFEEMLRQAAEALKWMDPAPVFIGGAVVPLYLDEFGQMQMRPTLDVDCIVPSVTTWPEYVRFEEELRARGWEPDINGPVCRYRNDAGLIMDFMPARPEALGFAGKWYPETATTAKPHLLRNNQSILISAPSLLLACKLEAFGDRGRNEPEVSKDLEDIVALVDGCDELEQSVAASASEVRRYVAAQLAQIQLDGRILNAAIAQLPRGGDETERERRFRARMERLVYVPNPERSTEQ